MKNQDVTLEDRGDYYDLAIGEDGDFEKINSFDTAITLSIFCERRASVTEVPESFRRRGWIGSQNQPVEYGSKLWLLHQSRLINKTVNQARDYLNQCLSWLVTFGYLESIEVNVVRDFEINGIVAEVTLKRFHSEVEHRNYILWENTGA